MRRILHNGWLWAGGVVFVGLIFLPSIWVFAATIGGALLGLGGEGAALAAPSGRVAGLIGRSVALGAGAMGVALLLGTATGFATTRVRFPGRRLLFALLVLPILIPGYTYALAWVDWLAPGGVPPPIGTAAEARRSPVYSLGAAIVVLGLHLFPWVHVVAGAGFAATERRLDEAGRFALGGAARFARITLPLVAGVLAAAGLFVFVLGLKNQGVPELLRQRVFATEILIAYQLFLDERQAALKGLAGLLVALAALGLALWLALRRRRIGIEGLSAPWRGEAGEGEGRSERGRAVAAAGLALAVFGVAFVAPMFILVRAAGAWENYRIVLASAQAQIVTGLATAAAVATACVALGFLLAEIVVRAKGFAAALIVVAVFVLFALPAPVLDIGLIRFWNRPGPLGAVYDSPAMLVLGQTAAFLPIAVIGLWVARRRIAPHLLEAAELAGLPWRTIAGRIVAPLLRGWFAALWAIVFVLALNDVEAAVLLAPPGGDTIAVRIMTLLHYAPDAQVAALCVVQVALAATVIGVVAAGMGMANSRS